jgi:hypothetical protein
MRAVTGKKSASLLRNDKFNSFRFVILATKNEDSGASDENQEAARAFKKSYGCNWPNSTRPFPEISKMKILYSIQMNRLLMGLIIGVALQVESHGKNLTFDDVPYGQHERQVLDFYQVKSDSPTPVVVHFHGGGWVSGSEDKVPGLETYLKAGISVVTVRYRYSQEAQLAGIEPPVKAPMEDARRAIQFLRSKAKEWNINPKKIGATGNSAGGCTSLWLAFRDDMADPKSADPIARESTRLTCVGIRNAQTTLDPSLMKEWTPNSRYGGSAFGFMDPHDTKSRDTQFDKFLAARDKILPWIKEYSPIEHATSDDPPIYISYTNPPDFGKEQKDPTHTANFGIGLKKKLDQLNVSCEIVYPGAPDIKHDRMETFLIATLKAGEK